jgi:glycosyltransferase involved in cell wall biosynthesis
MLSIIVPVLNEDESLEELHRQIDAACRQHGIEVELVLIDDGSTDNSWQVISRLAQSDPRVTGIRFRRNLRPRRWRACERSAATWL